MEHMIRACLIALRLAESAAIDDAERGVMYYSGLLAWVGCHTDAYEQAKWLGDDLAVKRDAHYGYDFGKAGPATAFLVKHVGGAGLPVRQRVLTGVQFPGDGRRALAALAENHYLATDQLAAKLGLGEQVRASLRQSYERWDGKGAYGLRGDQIAMSSRLINLADVVEVFRRTGGIDAALAVARERSGTQFDPDLVDLFCQRAPLIFGDLDAEASWDLVIDAEPSLGAVVSGIELDDALSAIGEFAELKSPWLMGHARGVAELAADAARSGGLPQADVSSLRRAAYVHDIGRLGVSNAVWDKPASLTRPELERVRLHPYLTERMLSFSAALAPVGAIAGQHHERLDGSGYPRGLSGDAISTAGRILAAADSYHALTEPRPHRPPRSAADAATTEAEAERIRLHPYLTDRMLARVDALGASRQIAARHHERLDGSGYPRGLTAAALAPPERLLAAADAYHAMTEPRPHRAPLGPGQAARELRAEVTGGRLDSEAAEAVLAAAGHRVPARRAWPGGLTAREVEVLRLLARGHSNRDIAQALVVTPKTAMNHVEHIYAKIGVSSRAAATLYATQHGLLGAFESAS
jgi:HD-GYP domain-containing protein (c-di-GMP phosphodiesterase class II)